MKEASETDRAAIIHLIESETAAFWNKDFDAWAQFWVHDDYVRRWGWWAARGGITVRDGWDDHAARMRRLMMANPARNESTAAVRRKKLVVRVGGDVAWATFDQHAPSTGDGMDVPGLTHEMRILEKHDGEWKIACLFFLQRSMDHLSSAVVRVDEQARIMWMNAAAESELGTSEVIEKRAGRLRAVDRAADQLLKAAVRWAAHLDDELYPERAAVPIVLSGGLGTAVNVCWVIGESGLVLVSINDRPMTEERLTAASLVYGITPAQLRLAKLIIGGHDIVTAAKLLEVSVNTARTHLQRMYDRTGVRSQPALVRAMLSVARPLG